MPLQNLRRRLKKLSLPRNAARHRPLFCESLEQRTLLAADIGPTWQNPHDPLDVDANCVVNQADADRLRQKLAADGATPLPTAGPVDYYWNVNGDDMISQADLDLIVQHLAASSSNQSSQKQANDTGGGDTMSSMSGISLILTQPPDAYEGIAFTLEGRISPAGIYDLDGDGNHYYQGFQTQTDENGLFTVSFLLGDDGPSPGNGTSSDVYELVLNVWLVSDPEATAQATTSVTVHNRAPELETEFRNYAEGGPVWEIPGLIRDEGLLGSPDLQTLTVDWGDGSDSTVLQDIPAGVEFDEIPGHQYKPDGGTYTITLTAEDDDGGTDTDSKTFTMYTLDIDNTLSEPVENVLPGELVSVNEDLAQFTLNWVAASRPDVNNYVGWELTLSFDDESTGSGQVWTTQSRTELVQFNDELAELNAYGKTWVIGTDPVPTSLYLDAIGAGILRLRFDLWSPTFGLVDGDAVVYTALGLDLDTDSDNTGEIEGSALEEADEMTPPGNIVLRNIDDDNGNGTPDHQDSGPFVDASGNPVFDDDLEPMIVRLEEGGHDLTGFTIGFAVNSSKLKVWSTQDKQALLTTITIDVNTPRPLTVYVEGIDIGAAAADATLKDASGAAIDNDSVLFTVVTIDAIAYRPQTPLFVPWKVPADEEDNAVGIRRNGDTDSAGQEDDLIRVDLNGNPQPAAGLAWKVWRSNLDIKVWGDSNKGTPVLTGEPLGTYANVDGQFNVFTEWVSPSGNVATFEYSVWDATHNRKVFFDDIVFKPFTSVVVFIGGRDQLAADPNPTGQGIFDLAIEEYRESGRDVYMYNHSDAVWGVGDGMIYDMIVNAINNHGQTNVAIMGYSWGGGATYDLTDLLQQNRNGTLTRISVPFLVPFTGYIDAIKHDFDLDGRAEDRRPPLLEVFHCAQYETWGPWVAGGPSGGDDDIDRTYLGATGGTHITIDDNRPVVLELLQTRLRQKVLP